jgi:hypothetical protein
LGINQVTYYEGEMKKEDDRMHQAERIDGIQSIPQVPEHHATNQS